MKHILAIDTSTAYASIALAVNGEVQSLTQNIESKHARFVLPMVAEMLAKAQLKISQLDGIVYGKGPGSFTGLRIACSLAKGLAFAQDLPLFPVSTLLSIASEALTKHEGVLAILDARMHQIYWACYTKNSLGKEQVSFPQDVIWTAEESFILAGVGFDEYVSNLADITKQKMLGTVAIYPRAEAMIALVLSGKIKPCTAAAASITYLRDLEYVKVQ